MVHAGPEGTPGIRSLFFGPVLAFMRRRSHPQEQTPSSLSAHSEAVSDITEITGEESTGDEYDWDPYYFIKTLPPLSECAPSYRPCVLPKRTRQSKTHTLVLDLDETLVHSEISKPPEATIPPTFTFTVDIAGTPQPFFVWVRPGLHDFLRAVSELYEVVVFTASQKVYADAVLNVLDPKRNLIRFRIFREDCVVYEGNYLKDLSILGRDLSKTIIVDNSPQAFGFQLDNGVPIETWFWEPNDRELTGLLPFLQEAATVPDVRVLTRRRFGLRDKVDQATDPSAAVRTPAKAG